MPSFSTRSKDKLASCHPHLSNLFYEVIKSYDCTILCGHRNSIDQERLFKEGKSQKRFGESKHNLIPSYAVDVAPYPIPNRWGAIDFTENRRLIKYQSRELGEFYYFAGYVMGIAKKLGIKIRWGGDWNMNNELNDQQFFDLPHFELLSCP